MRLSVWKVVGVLCEGPESEVLLDEVHHHVEEVQPCVASVDAMVAVGIDKEVKVFVGVHQRVDHLHGVLVVDIVVP